MSARFQTVSITGYPAIGSDARMTDAYVLDSAYGFQVVEAYREREQTYPGGPFLSKAARTADVHARATARAAELNAEHEAWLAETAA